MNTSEIMTLVAILGWATSIVLFYLKYKKDIELEKVKSNLGLKVKFQEERKQISNEFIQAYTTFNSEFGNDFLKPIINNDYEEKSIDINSFTSLLRKSRKKLIVKSRSLSFIFDSEELNIQIYLLQDSIGELMQKNDMLLGLIDYFQKEFSDFPSDMNEKIRKVIEDLTEEFDAIETKVGVHYNVIYQILIEDGNKKKPI